jgi:hypothetical protein
MRSPFPLRIVSWNDSNNDPRMEFEAGVGFIDALLKALQDHYNVAERDLATGETEALSQEDIRSWIEFARKRVIPVLRRGGRPPKRQQRGRPAESFRDCLISETEKQIRQKYEFSRTRNPGTTDRECCTSIISTALSKLGIELSENRINSITKP